MIDPAGRVPVHTGIDIQVVLGVEQERMRRRAVLGVATIGLVGIDQRTLVLDQPLALGNGTSGEDAVTVDGRAPPREARSGDRRFSFLHGPACCCYD